MTILDVIFQAFKLGFLIIGEWLSASAAQRAADEKFQASEKEFRAAYLRAVEKMTILANKENQDVQASDDWLDDKTKPKP